MRTTPLILALSIVSSALAHHPVVVAHRGASGYLPEHTLVAKAYAHAQAPDFIEQDVVLSKDDVPVVLHDHHIDTTTDVARVYPKRRRKYGRYYAIDFTAAELARLTVHERVDLATGAAVYPKRFPLDFHLPLRIPTLDQEITLIQGLNRSTGRNVGLYVELKVPWFHRAERRDLEGAVTRVLAKRGYDSAQSNVWLQTFDPACLERLRAIGCKLRAVQLIGLDEWNETPGVTYAPMLTHAGLARIAQHAQGIGPYIGQLLRVDEAGHMVLRPEIVKWAHEHHLQVHPYTVRTDQLPPGIESTDRLLDALFHGLGVDGVFTDFPDIVAKHLHAHGER